MSYSDFVGSPDYVTKASGAGMTLQLIDVNDPAVPVLDAMGGISFSEAMPDSPVEEAGEDRVNEFVKERYTGNGNVSFFYTAQRNDKMPTVETFLGREFILVERIAPKRPGAGNVVNYCEGVTITGTNVSHGARGIVSGTMSINFKGRLNGAEYAARFGA